MLLTRHASSINLIDRGLLFRIASDSDIPAIDKIARQYPDELAFVRKVSIKRGIDNLSCHVACFGDVVVGFVLFHRRRDGWQTIYDLGIDRQYTGLGIGRNLLYSVPCPIRLKCKSDNARAIRFYENAGMRVESSDDKLTTFVMHHLFIFCAGNNALHPSIAKNAGMAYGCAQNDKPKDYPFMMDVEFLPEKQDWQDYMHKICTYRPVQAMVTDYMHKSERSRLYEQIRDLKNEGVLRIKVCPKFDGAIKHIPQFCMIALSVPTNSEKFSGWLPSWQEMSMLRGRQIHLLGGTPSKQAALIDRVKLYGGRVISVDGNSFQKAATKSTVWMGGRWRRSSDNTWLCGDYETTLKKSAENIQQYINAPETWLIGSTANVNKKRIKDRQLTLL